LFIYSVGGIKSDREKKKTSHSFENNSIHLLNQTRDIALIGLFTFWIVFYLPFQNRLKCDCVSLFILHIDKFMLSSLANK
jgi:hypothetical protein